MLADWMIAGAAAAAAARFAYAHITVSRSRAAAPGEDSGRRTDSSSMLGLALESAGFAVLISGGIRHAEPAWHWAGAALAWFSAWVVFQSVAALGRQWRIQAVVTDTHELVDSGPYGVVRHPIYGAVLGFLCACGFAFARWPFLAAALVIYLFGTELRVRAEDRLLLGHFGDRAREYQRRVKAYVPFVR
jgi:protein-S-isoprenylcysteine O-methyltransferase Ste14